MGHLADMYRSGNHVGVWTDLVAVGSIAVEDDQLDETREVARLTMLTVRRNLELVVNGLADGGYVFEPAEGDAILSDRGSASDVLDDLEARVGRMPVALRAFAEHSGSVSLAGRHPSWNGHLADPLILTFAPEYVLSEYELFVEDQDTTFARAEFTIDLAPDHLHKAEISGGAPFAMAVPYFGADALLRGERHQTTLVNYLRIALRWGGFPGWDPAIGPDGTGIDGPWPEALRDLAGSLEPF